MVATYILLVRNSFPRAYTFRVTAFTPMQHVFLRQRCLLLIIRVLSGSTLQGSLCVGTASVSHALTWNDPTCSPVGGAETFPDKPLAMQVVYNYYYYYYYWRQCRWQEGMANPKSWREGMAPLNEQLAAHMIVVLGPVHVAPYQHTNSRDDALQGVQH